MTAEALALKAKALALRHEALAAQFDKRKHTQAGGFHHYTADLLSELARRMEGQPT